MTEFLGTYLFHWVPSKAIWIGGHTLSWDARCAGIYAGFCISSLCLLAARRDLRSLVSAGPLAFAFLFAAPLFVDVFLRIPSNESRFLTGLLFGTALSLGLVPAVSVLVGAGGGRAGKRHWLFGLLLALDLASFYAKDADSEIAWLALETACALGFLGLLGVLSAGLVTVIRRATGGQGVRAKVLLVALISLLGGCVTAPLEISREEGACVESQFAPSRIAACTREVCRDGRILVVEDLTQSAPVDDWAEERFCLQHPIKCLIANSLKERTERWQKGLTGKYWSKDDEHNGPADAARHAHLMCTITERLGADFARQLGIAHEEDSAYLLFFRMAAPGNPCCEKVTDLHNNEVGIKLGEMPGSCEEKVLKSLHLLRYSLCSSEDDSE